MKTFIICFALLGGISIAVESSELKKYAEECVEEFKVNPEEMIKMAQGAIKPEDVKENMKCSLKCFLTKLGIMDEKTGEAKKDYPALPAEYTSLAKDEIDKCVAKKGSDACDTAFQIMQCIWTKSA